MKLTDEQEKKVAQLVARLKLGIDELLDQLAEPKTPDRAGQWYKQAVSGHLWGVITRSIGKRHELEGEGDWLSEQNIQSGQVLRIPPPPADAPADLKGWECREPKGSERWYAHHSSVVGALGCPYDHPLYGRRRWIEPEPAEPEAPDRTGQWFMQNDADDPYIYGPITSSDAKGHWGIHDRSGQEELWLAERNIDCEDVLRIPPRPNDKCVECREPVGESETWYDVGNGYVHSGPAGDHPDYGKRRWIRLKPERELDPAPKKTPWPVGPFTVHEDQVEPANSDYYEVRYSEGSVVCRQCHKDEADAIALALPMLRKMVPLVREYASIDRRFKTLLAELGASRFDLGEGER